MAVIKVSEDKDDNAAKAKNVGFLLAASADSIKPIAALSGSKWKKAMLEGYVASSRRLHYSASGAFVHGFSDSNGVLAKELHVCTGEMIAAIGTLYVN